MMPTLKTMSLSEKIAYLKLMQQHIGRAIVTAKKAEELLPLFSSDNALSTTPIDSLISDYKDNVVNSLALAETFINSSNRKARIGYTRLVFQTGVGAFVRAIVSEEAGRTRIVSYRSDGNTVSMFTPLEVGDILKVEVSGQDPVEKELEVRPNGFTIDLEGDDWLDAGEYDWMRITLTEKFVS